MNEQTRPEGNPILRLKQLRCRRLDRLADLEEHESCPYCFGHRQALLTGRYETFCDWQPGRDPVQFGFPPGTRRELHG